MKMWENLRNRHSKANRISQIMMMQNDLHHQGDYVKTIHRFFNNFKTKYASNEL